MHRKFTGSSCHHPSWVTANTTSRGWESFRKFGIPETKRAPQRGKSGSHDAFSAFLRESLHTAQVARFVGHSAFTLCLPDHKRTDRVACYVRRARVCRTRVRRARVRRARVRRARVGVLVWTRLLGGVACSVTWQAGAVGAPAE